MRKRDQKKKAATATTADNPVSLDRKLVALK